MAAIRNKGVVISIPKNPLTWRRFIRLNFDPSSKNGNILYRFRTTIELH